MKKTIIILAALLTGGLLRAQSVPMALEDWKTNQGTQNFFYKNVTKTDPSGNVVVAGATMNNGTTDILVAKYNGSGNQLWIRQFAGSATNGVDFAAGLYVTATDVYITGAISNNNSVPETDCVTMKLSGSTGSIIWSTSYSGAGGSHDAGTNITVDGSGNVYVSGGTYNASLNTDYLAIKYNSSGVQQWASTWDYAGADDGGIAVVLGGGSNVNIAGAVTTPTPGVYKMATVRFANATGALLATNVSTAVTTSSVEAVTDMALDASGNILIAGSQDMGTHHDLYVQKLDGTTMASQWVYTWNGPSSLDDYAKAVAVDASNNVYVAGFSTSSSLGRELTLIKLNSSGVNQWTQSSGLSGDDEAADLVVDASNNLYVAGYRTNATKDYYTVKYNSAGTKVWEIQADGNSGMDDNATNMALDSLNNVIVTGQSKTGSGDYEFMTVKYDQYDVIPPADLYGGVNDKSFLFYENIGQELDESLNQLTTIKFVTSTSPKYYFNSNRLSMVFSSASTDSNMVDTIHRIDLNFIESQSLKIYGMEDYGVNQLYILGQLNSPMLSSKGKQRLIIPELYPGIDLHYYSNKDGGLKYYFIIRPGADPRKIVQFFNSTNYSTALDVNNHLLINSSVGSIELERPLAYQLNSTGIPLSLSGISSWRTLSPNMYDFDLPLYSDTMTLVILVNQKSKQSILSSVGIGNLNWSTFTGGGSDDQSWAVTIDASGNQHIAGASSSINYPQTGFQVVQTGSIFTNNRYGFYQKFNSQHELRVSAFIGGNDQTDAFDVEVNSTGSAYIIGTTSATNFLTKNQAGAFNDNAQGSTANGAEQDCFIIKFDINNQYVWGTYFGGTKNDNARSIAIDNSDNVYIVGTSDNGSLPLIPNGSAHQQSYGGIQDGFIARFGANDNINWFTFIGGSNIDYLYSCKTDINGSIFVSGSSYSNNFPTYRSSSSFYKDSTLSGTYDMVMLKFNSGGVRQWSSYFGGTGEEGSLYYPTHKGIAIDQSQNVYFADNTTSSDMFIKRSGSTCYYDSTFGGNIDGFILKFNSSLAPQYSTYVGGSNYDYAHAIAFDSSDNLYLSYGTSSGATATKVLGNYYNQSSMNNPGTAVYAADNFILSLYNNLNPRWATFFGGTSYNAQGDEGTDIAIKSNKLFLTGYCNSYTANSSTDIRFPIFYPGTPAYIDSTYNDQSQTNTADAFISMFDLSQIVGIDEFNSKMKAGEISMFPNPTNSILNLKFKSLREERIKLTIFTIDGKKVFETHYPTVEGENLIQINTISLSTGMYVIKLDANDYSITEKFVRFE